MERTLVILKPSIPDTEFWENIVISRDYFKKIFERVIRMKWFKIDLRKQETLDLETAKNHYYEKENIHYLILL